MGFHRYDLHAKLGPRATKKYRTKHRKMRKAWNTGSVVLYKTHRFDEELLDTCESSLVITSTMDQHLGVEDTLASACAAGWVDCRLKGGSLKGTAQYIERALREHQRWLMHSALNIEKSRMRSPFSFLSVCASIAGALGLKLSPEACLPSEEWMSEARYEEANPSIPHKRKIGRLQSRALMLAVIEEAKRLQLPLTSELRLEELGERDDGSEGVAAQGPQPAV